jgi:hypothetical protein
MREMFRQVRHAACDSLKLLIIESDLDGPL